MIAPNSSPVIAMTTDFGLDDPYVGVMKGVILAIVPEARLVDLTHGVPAQDALAGCLALEASRVYFPRGTIYLAVVDPGVGTERAGIVVETPREVFVAPDNGLLSFLADDEIVGIRRIENPDFMLHPVSKTFHGRDVFAPAAAHLAAGVPPETFGPLVANLQRIPIPTAAGGPDEARGELLTFDRFGNGITSIRETDLPAGAGRAWIKGLAVPLVSTYGVVAPGSPLCVVGSFGRLEVSVRNGNARAELSLRPGDSVLVGP